MPAFTYQGLNDLAWSFFSDLCEWSDYYMRLLNESDSYSDSDKELLDEIEYTQSVIDYLSNEYESIVACAMH